MFGVGIYSGGCLPNELLDIIFKYKHALQMKEVFEDMNNRYYYDDNEGFRPIPQEVRDRRYIERSDKQLEQNKTFLKKYGIHIPNEIQTFKFYRDYTYHRRIQKRYNSSCDNYAFKYDKMRYKYLGIISKRMNFRFKSYCNYEDHSFLYQKNPTYNYQITICRKEKVILQLNEMGEVCNTPNEMLNLLPIFTKKHKKRMTQIKVKIGKRTYNKKKYIKNIKQFIQGVDECNLDLFLKDYLNLFNN